MDTSKLKVGITGVTGLIGWHLLCHLMSRTDTLPIRADRTTFANQDTLDLFVKQCDVIVHLAALNRGTDSDVESINLKLADELVRSLERTKCTPHVLYSSSIHAKGETLYGRTKKQCGEMLQAWSTRSGARFTSLLLPHVFGELGRPFHNSVVSTFCHQIANSETPRITSDSQLELRHAQSVAELISDAILTKTATGKELHEIAPGGKKISVSQLLSEVQHISATYQEGIIPDLRDPFTLDLFNTYRSYLFPARSLVTLHLNSDSRGHLFEAVKTEMGGQCFVSTTKPGITRGNHFHLRKLERFLVTSGEAIIRVRRLDHTDVTEFRVSGERPQFIDIPTLHTHNITNVGDADLTTLFWAHEIFDPDRPDTFRETV